MISGQLATISQSEDQSRVQLLYEKWTRNELLKIIYEYEVWIL